MDWFERLTGFREGDYHETRARLGVDGDRLRSLVNGESYGIGTLELVSLETLRERVNSAGPKPGKLKVSIVTGDVRAMHRSPEYAGALFQVASQFNLLEMVSPEITPEAGVTRYEHDRTQGPACAIAAGAATIYRNYFAPVGHRAGQTKDHQLDGLADLGDALSGALKLPVSSLWKMQNGYALCSERGLDVIANHLGASDARELDRLRRKLRIGLHRDVEVTEPGHQVADRARVSQAFCSALPVAYTSIDAARWAPFARLVLEAAYEATMLAAIENARSGTSNIVLLTQLGGGAFGNRDEWIHDAIRRALKLVSHADLDVRLVSYGDPSRTLLKLARDFE